MKLNALKAILFSSLSLAGPAFSTSSLKCPVITIYCDASETNKVRISSSNTFEKDGYPLCEKKSRDLHRLRCKKGHHVDFDIDHNVFQKENIVIKTQCGTDDPNTIPSNWLSDHQITAYVNAAQENCNQSENDFIIYADVQLSSED